MDVRDWRILVIDDEPDSLELIQAILTYHGVTSVGVGTAEEGLTALETMTPTMIIIDLALPHMDGWNFLKQVQTDPVTKDVPTVAVTAFHSPLLTAKALAAGFDAFFPKPIDATVFIEELGAVIREKRGS